MIFSEEEMRSANNGDQNILLYDIIEYKEDIEIVIEQIPDNDDELVRRWRIQLDVTTTRKKLKEIEKIVNEKVREIL